MGIVIRQSIITSLISYVGVIIGYFNLVYLFPKYLDLDQVGLLRTIQDTAMLFAPFAVFGLGQSIIKFFPRHSADQKKSNQFITFIITLSFLTFTLFLGFFFIFQNQIMSFLKENAGELIKYQDLILSFTFFLVILTLLEQYSRSLLQIALPSFLREVGIRVFQAILVFMFVFNYLSFQQFIHGSVWIYFIIVVILLLFLTFKGNYRPDFRFREIPSSATKEIAIFSILSFIGTSSMILIGKMDSVMVTVMLGFKANAIYTTAFYMATVIEIPKRAITTTASPLIAKAFAKNNLAEISSIYRKTSINQFLIGSLLLIGIYANIENIFSIMPKGNQYSAGALVILIVGVGKLVDMVFGPSSEIIGLSRHYWFNLVVISFLAILIIVTNKLLIPVYGLNGAAYGSLISLVIYNVAKFIFIYFKFKIQPFDFSTIKVVIISLSVLLVNYLIPKAEYVMLDIIIRSTIITLLYGILIMKWNVSAEVNQVMGKFSEFVKDYFSRK